jgi:signal transduction histidine kinase
VDGLCDVQKLVRHVSHGLIPVEVDAEGLRAALEDLADRISQQVGIKCVFHARHQMFVRDALTATHLYYIVQEATNNAIRHGKPKSIDIHINADPDTLVVTVQDDGVGIPEEQNRRNGIGLRLMRYRASLIGAAVNVAPGERKGTVVKCTLTSWQGK